MKAGFITYCSKVYLWVDDDSLFTSPITFGPFYTDTSTNFSFKLSATGLLPDTKYFYATGCDSVPDFSNDAIGKIKTFKNGPQSFRIAFGSCSLDNNHRVYTVIDSLHPDVFMNIGDLHYADPNSLNITVHRLPYDNLVFSKPVFMNMIHKRGFVFVWDDHDYCGNGADSLRIGRSNARKVYQDYVPHYILAEGSGDVAIYQSFVIGRIKFIMTDMRSERGALSMLGNQQKNWFKNECRHARDNNLMIAWISSGSWQGILPHDNWGMYPDERKELADFFISDSIQNMMILSGDAHMLAIDDGSHSDFSTFGNCPYKYPIFQAAALNQGGSYKGGIYSEDGYFLNPNSTFGQFGTIDVIDDGDSLCFLFTGYRVSSVYNTQILVQYQFCKHPGAYILNSNLIESDIQSYFIHPIPSNDFLTIDKRLMNLNYNLVSIDGKIIRKGYSHTNMIDIHALEKGLYILQFEKEKEIITFKIIKN